MKNWLIKKLGGLIPKEVDEILEKERDFSFKNGEQVAYSKLKSIIVSKRADIDENRLPYMSGFIDYICVQVGMPKIYDNGTYEKFIKEL